jgi:hypothetical protein
MSQPLFEVIRLVLFYMNQRRRSWRPSFCRRRFPLSSFKSMRMAPVILNAFLSLLNAVESTSASPAADRTTVRSPSGSTSSSVPVQSASSLSDILPDHCLDQHDPPDSPSQNPNRSGCPSCCVSELGHDIADLLDFAMEDGAPSRPGSVNFTAANTSTSHAGAASSSAQSASSPGACRAAACLFFTQAFSCQTVRCPSSLCSLCRESRLRVVCLSP